MKKICLVLALTAILSVSTVLADAEVDEGVLVLTDSNFDTELAKYDNLLVEFYAPWCGHCKSLAPEYAKAAQKLRENNPPYHLGKVDATENKQLAEKYGIRGFPTLFFFKKGQKLEYTGGRTEPEIVNWILKKVGPPSNEVTCDTLDAKIEGTKLAVAFFGDTNSKEYQEVFLDVAQNPAVSEKFTFFHTSETSCAEKYGAKSTPTIVLFRKFDESPLVQSGELTSGATVQWMQDSSVPTLIEFSEDYIEPIFGQRKAAVILFRNKEEETSDYAKIFNEAATKLKGKILFVVSGVKDGIQHRLADFIGVDETSVPTIRILNPGDNMKKFTFPGDTKSVNFDELSKFIDEFSTGSLKPFLKSAEPPADNTEPVKVIVGKTFKEIVLDNEDDVLVKYYAPWCGHCKKLAPIWDQVAADLKDVKGLTIAKFDATANEVDGLEIRGYPTLKFYPAGQKGAPVDFDGERGADDIKAWLKEKSVNYKKYLDAKEAKAEL